MTIPAPEYKRIKLSILNEDVANARTHPEKNLNTIRASLNTFGQVEPLVVQKSTMRVVGGNGRLQVMRTLGWEECDIAVLDINDTQAASLSIALNRTSETAKWDTKALADIIRSLETDDELLAATGFEDSELENMLTMKPDSETGDPDTDPVTLKSVFEVIVECKDEVQQREVFDRLTKEGMTCRVLSL